MIKEKRYSINSKNSFMFYWLIYIILLTVCFLFAFQLFFYFYSVNNLSKKDFEKILNKSEYQVFLFTSNAVFPFHFAKHPWFVINKKGEITRWEIFQTPKKEHKQKWWHIHKDYHSPLSWIEKYSFSKSYFWNNKFIWYVEWDKNSYVLDMIKLIESSPEKYLYLNKYSLTGPNSNTYVQWILNKFPESKLTLPINSFGKNYKK